MIWKYDYELIIRNKLLAMKNLSYITISDITCTECGFTKTEDMPTDSCQHFYECTNCKTLLKPKKGDCCVFCSYGTVKCPSMQ